jgi:hypothetical protein
MHLSNSLWIQKIILERIMTWIRDQGMLTFKMFKMRWIKKKMKSLLFVRVIENKVLMTMIKLSSLTILKLAYNLNKLICHSVQQMIQVLRVNAF